MTASAINSSVKANQNKLTTKDTKDAKKIKIFASFVSFVVNFGQAKADF